VKKEDGRNNNHRRFQALAVPELSPQLFRQFCELVYEKAGISLKKGKEELVAARLKKRQRVLGIEKPGDYLKYLKDENNGYELVHFLDAISTNYTKFFRERDHFVLLAKAVKVWVAQGQRRLRFWSAASSSGEEPYSMAMTVLEAAGDGNLDFKILATDISTEVLHKARIGIYASTCLEAFTKRQRLLFTSPLPGYTRLQPQFQINSEVRKHVVFKRLNLSRPPFPMSGPLDAIFCRNVMIYFDQTVRSKLIADIVELLKPGGLLITGHTETLMGIKSELRMLSPSVYCRPREERKGGNGRLSLAFNSLRVERRLP
jgi:chemotaxis protein methyltransferase CheR